MSPADVHAEAAELLWNAQVRRQPTSPLTQRWPDLTVSDAYVVAQQNVARRVEAGDVVKGHKVGLSSRAMQRQLGVNEPDYGTLLSSMFHLEETALDPGLFVQPRVEVELAFVLGRPLTGPGCTVADVMRAVDFVCPSIEIVDSRIADWRLQLVDTIADNASSGAVVLGGRPRRLIDLDPRDVGAELRVDGQIVETGTTAAVLGNPVSCVAWLANTLGAHGVCLEPGHVVLPGACTAMAAIGPGSVVSAHMSGFGAVHFTMEGQI